MSSSISSSEQLRPVRARLSLWRRWLIILTAVSTGGTALLCVAVVLLDPFATGRLTLFSHFSVTTSVRMLAHAGRIRNPQFDSAIIGNSRGFAIDSARLSRGTGRKFVHLTLEAVYPQDQLRLLAVFARHHAGHAPTIVQVVDYENWCNVMRGATPYRVPWWLYEGSDFQYLQRILSSASVMAALRRASIALDWAGDVERRDGHALWLPGNTVQLRQAMMRDEPPTRAVPADAPLANLDDLEAALWRLEPTSVVALLMPPVFWRALPASGSPADARVRACKQRLERIAVGRPNTVFVDARRDTPATRDPMNFIDATHYLGPVAIEAEAALVAAINWLSVGRL